MLDKLIVEGLIGATVGVLYQPKTPVGYALKGAIGALIVYSILNKRKNKLHDNKP